MVAAVGLYFAAQLPGATDGRQRVSAGRVAGGGRDNSARRPTISTATCSCTPMTLRTTPPGRNVRPIRRQPSAGDRARSSRAGPPTRGFRRTTSYRSASGWWNCGSPAGRWRRRNETEEQLAGSGKATGVAGARPDNAAGQGLKALALYRPVPLAKRGRSAFRVEQAFQRVLEPAAGEPQVYQDPRVHPGPLRVPASTTEARGARRPGSRAAGSRCATLTSSWRRPSAAQREAVAALREAGPRQPDQSPLQRGAPLLRPRRGKRPRRSQKLSRPWATVCRGRRPAARRRDLASRLEGGVRAERGAPPLADRQPGSERPLGRGRKRLAIAAKGLRAAKLANENRPAAADRSAARGNCPAPARLLRARWRW